MSSRRNGTRRLSSEDCDWESKKSKIQKDSNGTNGKTGLLAQRLSSYDSDSDLGSSRSPEIIDEDAWDHNDSGFNGSLSFLMDCDDSALGGSVKDGKIWDESEEMDCSYCMTSRSVAPFVECQICQRSIDVDVKYWASEGWVVCHPCYYNKSKGPLSINTGSSYKEISKTKLEKRFNYITVPEPVIECTLCSRSFHKMCVNYPRPVSSSTFLGSDYICADCEKKRYKLSTCISLPVSISAESISHTPLSLYMEERIRAIYPKMPKVLVRVASSVPKKYTLDGSLGKYCDKRELEYPYMAKTICCFQLNEYKKYHMIFVLYVQEYDEDCPMPNRNTIYISVLDSVRLLQPITNRTNVFHLVLLTYFDYMRMYGFKSVFLWSCPPGGPGMDYAFYRKPRNQRLITAELLNNWYQRLFSIGRSMNTLAKFSTLNDWAAQEICSMEDFHEKFPFFQGDHWPDEVARLIDIMNKTQSLEDSLFKNLQSKLARNKNSFHVLTLNITTAQKNFRSSDVVIPSVLADNRDMLVKFFRMNYLEFEDERKATYATQAVVLQIALEQTGSKLGSMGFNCHHCSKGIREGYACMECEYRGCKECWNSDRHHHTRLRKIVLPIKIPNLFTEEFKWNKFKNDILGSSMQSVCISSGNLTVASKDVVMRIKHCSVCTLDVCSKCQLLRNEFWDLLKIPGGR